ncbi:diguanylate cyclase domain-containing protein, partial [Pseudomaricurvus sp.]|uniref:diguanylate cyclase domain-containing protein n=1 Tax=Pseudomaricurvus sp. TaxID=2004510 RepID=UPI003F6BB948
MGLRAKLLVTLLGLLLLSLGVLGGVTYWLFESKLRGEALSYQRNIASQLIIGARADLVRISAALKQLSENTALISGVESGVDPQASGVDPQNSAGLSTIQSSFDNFQRLNMGVGQVILFDRNGDYILHSPTYAPVMTDHLDVEAVLNSRHVMASGLTRSFYADAAGGHMLVSVAPVRSRTEPGVVHGYITTVSGLDSFKQMVEESDSSVTRLFFSDNDGHFLVKSPEIPFSSLPGDIAGAFNLADVGFHDSGVSGLGDVSSQPEMMDVGLSGGGQTESDFSNPHFIDMNDNGISYRLSMQRVAPNLWLGSLIDQRAIANNSLSLLAVLLPAAAVVIALSGFIFYLRVFGVILKPIEVLIQATRKISGGEYRPDIEIASEDELGELADAFRVMGRQLEDSGQQIAHLAYYDPLTELPNRTTLRATLSSMIEEAQRNDRQLAVLFIDLDDFKKVNDRLGHAAGDELLVQVGKRLQRRLRSSDVLADASQEAGAEQVISRRGGDEFNAILNNVHDAREAALVAERLIVDINEPLLIDGSVVTVGASVGVALFPCDGEDADTLLRHADMAMYEAKGLGKNKYYLFTESINAQVHERLEMEQSIAGGLQRNEFEVHYQPKVNL